MINGEASLHSDDELKSFLALRRVLLTAFIDRTIGALAVNIFEDFKLH